MRLSVSCLASVLAMSSLGLADTKAFLTHPDIHGDQVVFTAEGDLWLADLKTGDAYRLTSAPGVETSAHFSPDGTQLAFTAEYDGGHDVYVMPVSGGIPQRLTYDTSETYLPGALVQGWTPDGKNVLFNSSAEIYAPRFEQDLTQQLFSVSVTGGSPHLLPVPQATFAALNADGRRLAYVPSSSVLFNWFRYQGGAADQLWLTDLQTGKFKPLTHSPGIETQPVWVGANLYFVSERTGVRNLWEMNPDTLAVRQITFSKDLPVRYPASDGKRVVFQLGPDLAVYDPATDTTQNLQIRLHSDRVHARPFPEPVANAQVAALSPGGKRLALVVRGHLVTGATEHGELHRLVDDSAQRVQNPAWSPDGKKIVYVSDAGGEEQLYLIEDRPEAKPQQLTKALLGEHGTPTWSPDGKWILLGNRTGDLQLIDATSGAVKTIAHSRGELSSSITQDDAAFSPDSKWIAYSISLGWRLSTVYLYSLETGAASRVTEPEIDSWSPAFSADGKYLFVLQNRDVTQRWNLLSERMSQQFRAKVTGFTLSAKSPPLFEPVVADEEGSPAPTEKPTPTDVETDGLPGRNFDVPLPPGDYLSLLALSGKLVVQAGSSIQSIDLTTGKTGVFAENATLLGATPDGKNVLIRQGKDFAIADASTLAVKVAPLDGLFVTIDPVKEWRQMFEESWRVARDFFYAPGMHGIDWDAIHAKYAAQLPLVASRSDLTQLSRDMISELNTGHAFAGAVSEFAETPTRTASLGIDLNWDANAHAYRIGRILRGDAWDPGQRSPFAAPGAGVKEGDYLLQIQGTALRQDQNPEAILVGTAGQRISVTTNALPTLVGAKTWTITPLANDRELRLKEWIRRRHEYVEKASGGQLAYVYLSDLGADGAREFAEHYYPNVNKAGIILDIRGNDGGNISGNLLSDLSARITGFFSYRAGGEYRREGWAPMGHLAALADEFTFSDGDYFSSAFQRLKLGPLVGHRTLGGVVGSNWYRLVDGGGIGIPNYGAWTPGEWIVEGKGVVPDYEVTQDPSAVLAGRDPQLEKAVQLLMDELRKHPFTEPSHPPYPVKLGGSRGNP